jgi:CRISPR/Cas system-associated endonuclease/helicase Cas3
MDEDRIKSTKHNLVRGDMTESLTMLQHDLSEYNDLVTGEKKEMENKMDFTKSDLQQLKVAIETSEQKSQNEISDLKMELGPLTDKDHGLQAQISALNSVLTDKETGIQTRITASTGAGQDPQSTFASDFKNGLD